MRHIKTAPTVLTAILILATGFAQAERVSDVPNPQTRDGTWVTDLPGALRPDTAAQLNALITELENESSAEMAVVVIHSLDGKSIEEFALELFNLWGIGKAEINNGVLFLWSTGDRRVRIEVGDGLRQTLPDSRAGYVLDSFVIPRFKEGKFDEGVLEGMTKVAALVRGDSAELPPDSARVYVPQEPSSSTPAGPSPWLLVPGVGALAAGFVGFKRWRRYRKRPCPSCGTLMARLDEKADDEYLDKPESTEERLGSVDYDVWRCSSCGHHFTLRYPRWFSSYNSCPQCSHRTCSKTRTTIRSATTYSTGTARVHEDCEFCTYQRTYTVTIPRRPKSSSSSSSSSSSFGGGSSSGGGASRGY